MHMAGDSCSLKKSRALAAEFSRVQNLTSRELLYHFIFKIFITEPLKLKSVVTYVHIDTHYIYMQIVWRKDLKRSTK